MRLSAEQIDALHSATVIPDAIAADRRQRAQQHKNPTVLEPPVALERARSGLVALPTYQGER